MLQSIRDRATGWLAWIVVAVISIPFALWGVSSYFTGGSEPVVASVGDRDISAQQFSRFYQQQYRQLQTAYGDAFRPEQVNEAMLKRQMLEGLIGQTLLQQYTNDIGMAISDRQLAERIYRIEAFQGDDGRFSQDRYERLLTQQGYGVSQFERQFRRDLLVDQLRAAVQQSVLIARPEVDLFVRWRDQKREISYLAIATDAFLDEAEVTDEAITDYYREHKGQFQAPARVRVDYVVLSPQTVAEEIEPSEESLRALYESEKQRWTQPEERKVRHILVTGADKQARARAEALRRQLLGGANFADLARQESADPGSAARGGDLGWVRRSTLEGPFAEAAFALEPGEISEVVQSRHGFHIIQVVDVREGETVSFEEARGDLVEAYQREKLGERMYELGDRLATISFENPASLEPVAEALGLEIRHSPWLTKGGDEAEGIFAQSKVREAAFSQTVLNEGMNSEVLELEDGRLVVLRVAEHEPARAKPLDEALRGEIRDRLRRRQARQAAQQLAESLKAELAAGADAAALAERHEAVTFRDLGTVGREYGEGVDADIVATAFDSASAGQQGDGYIVTGLSDGDWAVVAIGEVIPGDPSKLSAEERESLRRQLADRAADSQLAAFVASLRKAYDVQVFADRL